MFFSGYDSMDERGKALFRNAVRRLTHEGSLQYMVEADRQDYSMIKDNRETVSAYLAMSDHRLIIDDDYNVIRYEPTGEFSSYNEIDKLHSRDEFAMLIIFRVALEEERARTGSGFHRMKIIELRNTYNAKMGNPLLAKRLIDYLPKFRRMKFISYTGDVLESDNSILILPLLLHLTPKNIEDMITVIRKSTGENNAEDEN